MIDDHEERALLVRFREPKTLYEEENLVEKAVPSSTKYKNKWSVSIFSEWQLSRTIKVPRTPFQGIKEMDALSLNYWLSKFVIEVREEEW